MLVLVVKLYTSYLMQGVEPKYLELMNDSFTVRAELGPTCICKVPALNCLLAGFVCTTQQHLFTCAC
jgi:hypothetical protein